MSDADDRHAEHPKRTCFVVSPIGAAGSPERKHANQVLDHIIRPTLADLHFEEPVRADICRSQGL